MVGPRPAEADARRALRALTRDLAPGDLVLVACSGGADSLALAATAAFVAPRDGWRAGAVVVDHDLQPGSAEVAARAADRCRALGLDPVEVRRVVVHGPGGTEAAARDARYAALEAAARDHGARAVLLGHTLDDQAETVLLGLARGSGARSLAGMPAVRGPFRRPFLGLRRRDTESVCAAEGLDYWEDPTNGAGPARGTPLRSRVRHEVVPVLERVLGPGVPAALARTADQLRDDGEVLDALAADLLERARAAGGPRATPATEHVPDDAPAPPPGSTPAAVVLDTRVLADAPRALRRRALRTALVEAGAPAGSLARTHVAEVDRLVTDWSGQGPLHLPGDLRARRACGRLFLHPPTAPPPSALE